MKIEKLKKTSNGKYKVYLDNNEVINTYDEVILKNNLLFHKEVDSELLNELAKDNDYYELYNKCLILINKRIRSEKEIREYLAKYTSDDKYIEDIISKLKEIGLINDLAFIKAFISDKINLSNDGPLKIANELLNHNIDSSFINIEIENIDQNLIDNKINKYISKKMVNNKYSSYVIKQKIISELINNGYREEDIIRILNNYEINSNVDKEINKQYKLLSKKYSGNDLLFKLKNKLYQKGYRKEEIDDAIKKMDI